MSEANRRQVGGDHYKGTHCPHCGESLEHWDLAWYFRWDNFQYAITKYIMRWRDKEGTENLEKAKHCIEKYIEVVQADIDAGRDIAAPIIGRPAGRSKREEIEALLDESGEPGPEYVDQD